MSSPKRFSRYARSRLVHAACAAALVTTGASPFAIASVESPSLPITDQESVAVKKRSASADGLAAAMPNREDVPITQSIAGGHVFVPINPYRTMDTRLVGGQALVGGNSEYFTVLTDIDGVQQIPTEAVAVTYNLTATDTRGPGFLAIYPADINWPGTSAINWATSGDTIANAGTIAIGDYQGDVGAVEILLNPAGSSAHYVLDITGYYF